MNKQMFEEHQLFDIQKRLEEEMIRNETLERKLRSHEFDHLSK